MVKITIVGLMKRLRDFGKKENFIVLNVRGDLQAVDLKDAARTLATRQSQEYLAKHSAVDQLEDCGNVTGETGLI
jgi:hypothetical protein